MRASLSLIASKNLNLLPVFIAIADEQSMSRAAQKLRLTQPAVSHALQRLREDFDDILFVRASHGMAPTVRALEILPIVRSILDPLTDCYRGAQQDLALIKRQITLASTTYFELRILSRLMEVLKSEVPLVHLNCWPLSGEFPKEELQSGDLDVAVAAYFKDIPESMRMKVLTREDHVCVFAKGHRYSKTRDRLKTYLDSEHISIAVPPGASQKVDESLEALGKIRKVAVSISNFMTPPLVLSAGDMILTCPRSLAEFYVKQYNLEIASTPIPIAQIEVKMVWHERTHGDPLMKWFRNQIEKSLGPFKTKS